METLRVRFTDISLDSIIGPSQLFLNQSALYRRHFFEIPLEKKLEIAGYSRIDIVILISPCLPNSAEIYPLSSQYFAILSRLC
jgi:hypothetical protein